MSPDIQEIIEQLRQHPRLVIAEDFEISLQRLSSSSAKFHNGVSSLGTSHAGYWISLRLLHRRQPGRAVTRFRTKEALGSLVDAAFESASRASVDLWFRFPIWKTAKKPAPVVEIGSQLTAYESLYPKLAAFPDVLDETYETWDIETHLYRKSERIQFHHARQVHALQYSVLNHAATPSGDKYFWLRDERAHARPLSEREDWLESLLRQSHALRQGRLFDPIGATASVVTAPAASAALLRRMAPWFHADAVQNGRSPLHGAARPGPLFSSAITILDSGNYPEAAHSTPFDMEGSLTQETTLVERGELRDLLYDAYSATRENRLSTGNFMRPPQADSPRIGATTLYVQKTQISAQDLLVQMDSGLLLESVDSMELVPGAENEFVVKGCGWRVERGQRAEPLWDICLKIDLFSLFQNALAVGSDLSLFGACGAPSILFENVPLSE